MGGQLYPQGPRAPAPSLSSAGSPRSTVGQSASYFASISLNIRATCRRVSACIVSPLPPHVIGVTVLASLGRQQPVRVWRSWTMAIPPFLVAAVSFPQGAVPALAATPAPEGVLTIMFGRGIVQETDLGCVVLPGSVSLFTVADELRARELVATLPMTVSLIGTTRKCQNGHLYASWSDLGTFRDGYGWTVVSRGANNIDLTKLTDPAELEANICGSRKTFRAHGHTRVWGMFAWPQNQFTDAYQKKYVTPCYAFGRRYTSPRRTNPFPIPYPFWVYTVSVNGGKCANVALPCHVFTPRDNRDYMQPSALAANVTKAHLNGTWTLLQFYTLVKGAYGKMGDRFAWNCTSPSAADHWTSFTEYYCWKDFLRVISAIPSDMQVTDPASVATLIGRIPPR
jgi:hypothetical protein